MNLSETKDNDRARKNDANILLMPLSGQVNILLIQVTFLES